MEEKPAVFSSLLQKALQEKKTIFIIVGIVIFISYIGINISVWTLAKNSQKKVKSVTSAFPTPSPTAGPTSTPTPRLTGPGTYACDPIGICNSYKDAKGAGCPKTYADSGCLDECGNANVRCPK